MRMDCAPMKKNMIALAARPASTCGVLRKELGRSAIPFFSSTRRSTLTRTTSTTTPHAITGRAGEMPKIVNGQRSNGAMRPQADTLERPIRKRNSPSAARVTPIPSNASLSPADAARGSRSESAATTAK